MISCCLSLLAVLDFQQAACMYFSSGSHRLAGQNLIFDCVYANDSDILLNVNVWWEKDGVPFISVGRIRILDRAGIQRALVITTSVRTDSGRYSCVAGGQRSPEVNITVVDLVPTVANLPGKTNVVLKVGVTVGVLVVVLVLLTLFFLWHWSRRSIGSYRVEA